MKATITSTDQIVPISKDGRVQARVWEGVTEGGVRFTAYIANIQVLTTDDNAEFERALREHKTPDVATQRAIDMRMII